MVNHSHIQFAFVAVSLLNSEVSEGFSGRLPLVPASVRQQQQPHHHKQQQRSHSFITPSSPRYVSRTTEAELTFDASVKDAIAVPKSGGGGSTATTADEEESLVYNEETKKTSSGGILLKLQEKIGTVEDDRIVFPEYESGEVSRMFSSLEYNMNEQGKVTSATHATGSVMGAAALIAGTTIGAGVLALPAATVSAGFVPSTVAMFIAWAYMTMSGLLIAELSINRLGETGRPGLGLLELYQSALGKSWGAVGSAAYFFLHYAMMVAYLAQGGANLSSVLASIPGLESFASLPGAGQVTFAAIIGLSLYAAKPALVENINNVLVAGVGASFLGIMALGLGDNFNFQALIDPVNQHPEQVANCFPILFLALVYQNVVPNVVTQLEGDRSKITKAVVGGTTMPLLMFLAWNAVVLGNVMGNSELLASMTNIDPVALLQNGAVGASSMMGPLVSVFSSLALVTSLIGFTYGLSTAWTDVFNIDAKGSQYDKWKPLLYSLVFVPPLALSVGDPDIFYRALDYGGAFGVSTLFLVLPPLMVWNERYGDAKKPLVTKPMVPLGKIPLGSMWKAAATLILEQGADKLGLFDLFKEQFLS